MNDDPTITAAKLDQLIVHVDTLRRCVIELSSTVRGHVIWNRDPATLGQLDAIDHVLRTLPL